MGLKIPSLLAQYLTTYKHLNITGIGIFVINEKVSLSQILFIQDNNTVEDKELISFLSSQTGKMKSLCTADLNSHVDLINQFLNIGKSFFFAEIGHLVKIKSGQINFTQINTEVVHKKNTIQSETGFEDLIFLKRKIMIHGSKLLIWLIIILVLGIGIWGGLESYAKRKTQNEQKEKSIEEITTSTKPNTPSTIEQDSMGKKDRTYRFIIEESTNPRAFIRFNLLKSYGLNIEMFTKDSLLFKLYFPLKIATADTLRIKDSLSALYVNPIFSKPGKVIIE